METIIIAIITLAAGVVIGIFIGRKDKNALEIEINIEKEKNRQLQENIAQNKENFEKELEKMEKTFEGISYKIMAKSQKDFQESSKVTIDTITQPLKETIDKMKVEMQQNALKQTEFSTSLKASTEQILQQSQSAQKSTDELIKVMSSSGKIQGNWGELVLEELLSKSGLKKGLNYETQTTMKDAYGTSIKTDEGSTLKPDVIVHFDESRDIIIDSKVSMTAYMKYINAQNEEERKKELKAHIDSITKHVNELVKKDYSSYFSNDKQKIDYVLMFVPNSGALSAVLDTNPEIWQRAFDYKVLLVDEKTLYVALKTISMTWNQIEQAKNHKKIFKLADELLSRVGMFEEKYRKIGEQLHIATKFYDEGYKKLTEKGQSIRVTCKNLQNLGAKPDVNHPLIDFDDEE